MVIGRCSRASAEASSELLSTGRHRQRSTACEESVCQRVRDQLSPQTREEITAMSVPAPAAAMPLRKDSFLRDEA